MLIKLRVTKVLFDIMTAHNFVMAGSNDKWFTLEKCDFTISGNVGG